MGILLRSAVVIGAIVYLAPLRSDKPPPAFPAPERASLSGTAKAVWQSLPDAAKKAAINEAQKRLINDARRNLLPDAGDPRHPAPSASGHARKPSG